MKISVHPLRGFTLIELVTTMLLVGILAVFAIGRLDFTSAFDEKAVHDKLMAGLQFARKAAVAQRRNVCVAVASNKATFTLDTRVPETTGAVFCNGSSSVDLALPSPDKTPGCSANQICASSGTTMTASTALTLDASGAATNTVTLTTTGQPDITVEVGTGYVH